MSSEIWAAVIGALIGSFLSVSSQFFYKYVVDKKNKKREFKLIMKEMNKVFNRNNDSRDNLGYESLVKLLTFFIKYPEYLKMDCNKEFFEKYLLDSPVLSRYYNLEKENVLRAVSYGKNFQNEVNNYLKNFKI